MAGEDMKGFYTFWRGHGKAGHGLREPPAPFYEIPLPVKPKILKPLNPQPHWRREAYEAGVWGQSPQVLA